MSARVSKIRSVLALAALVAAGCAGPRKAIPPPAPSPAAQAAPAAAPAAPQRVPGRDVPEKGSPPELTLPAQRHFTLANGLRVRLVEYRRLPIVAMNLTVLAGGARDPAGRPGLASLTASMLTEGTRTRSATRLSDEAGFLGASLGAGAGPDAAAVSGAVLARHLPRFLELFADVTMNPAFPAKDFERVQDQRLVALLQQRDQPQAIAGRAFVGAFWGDHPYGHVMLGTEASVKSMRPADLAAFHARHYRPGSAELVVVGAVSEAELRPLLERTLGRWKPGAKEAPPAERTAAAPLRTVLVAKPGAPQTYLLLGLPGYERDAQDLVPGSVMFQVLGGGMSSRLFRNLREEKGWTYGLGARGDARKLAGASVVAGSVKADVTGPAVKEILAELRRVREEPISEAELADARNALVLSLPADFATAGGIAGRLADLALHGLPDDYWSRYADEVEKVTAEDVRRVGQKYLDPSRLTLVMVGDPDTVKAQLAGLPLGPIEQRTPEESSGPAAVPARAGAR
jgi:predicted Zn-dependent peptidase